MSLRRALVANLQATAFGRLIAGLSPLLLLPAMIWRWGPDLYGEWVLTGALVAAGMLSPDLGFAHAAGNHIPRLVVEGREKDASALFRATLAYMPALTGAIAIAAVAIAGIAGPAAAGLRHFDRIEFIMIVALLAGGLMVAQQYFLLSPVYKIAGRNARLSLVLSLALAIEALGGLVIVLLGGGPMLYAAWLLVLRSVLLAVLWMDAQRLCKAVFDSAATPGPRQAFKQFAALGGAAAGQALTPIVNGLQSHGLTLVAGLCLSPALAGNLQALRTLANAVKSAVTTINLPVAQELPVLIGRKQTGTIQQLTVMAMHAGLAAALLVVVPLLLFGERIMTLWLGGRMPYEPVLATFIFLSVLAFPLHSAASVLLLSANRIQAAIFRIAAFSAAALAIAAIGAELAGAAAIGLLLLVLEYGSAAITLHWASKYFFAPQGIASKLLRVQDTLRAVSGGLSGGPDAMRRDAPERRTDQT